MDNIFIIFLIIIPISMFGTAFFVARQFRAFENVPFFSMMFVQRRLLFSFVMSFFMSLLLSIIFGLIDGFTKQLFISFIGIILLTTFSYYFGVKFGWGKSLSESENVSPTNQNQDNLSSENVIVDSSLSSIKITINSKKRWTLFLMEMFNFTVIGLCALPIVALLAISVLQNYLPENVNFLAWIIVGGLAIYFLYKNFRKALEFIFDKEIIEIDSLSVKIEKHGARFKSKKEYPADNIKKITAMFSLGGQYKVTKRSRFFNLNMPAFMLWHERGIKRYRSSGRAVDLVDAQSILEMIYSKFPQYKG